MNPEQQDDVAEDWHAPLSYHHPILWTANEEQLLTEHISDYLLYDYPLSYVADTMNHTAINRGWYARIFTADNVLQRWTRREAELAEERQRAEQMQLRAELLAQERARQAQEMAQRALAREMAAPRSHSSEMALQIREGLRLAARMGWNLEGRHDGMGGQLTEYCAPRRRARGPSRKRARQKKERKDKQA